MEKKTIFICHSSSDKPFVQKLQRTLESKRIGIRLWIDEGQIRVGDSLIGKIEEGIEYTDYFCIILSPNSIKSLWVKKELRAAITKTIYDEDIKIFPVLYGDCDIPLLIRDIKYADFRVNFEQGVRELIDALFPSRHFSTYYIYKHPSKFSTGETTRYDIEIPQWYYLSPFEISEKIVPLILIGVFRVAERYRDDTRQIPESTLLEDSLLEAYEYIVKEKWEYEDPLQKESHTEKTQRLRNLKNEFINRIIEDTEELFGKNESRSIHNISSHTRNLFYQISYWIFSSLQSMNLLKKIELTGFFRDAIQVSDMFYKLSPRDFECVYNSNDNSHYLKCKKML